MKMKIFFALFTCICLNVQVKADLNVNFSDSTSYKNLGVYDVWEESPFRTGQLKGNWAITDNPFPQNSSSDSKESSVKEKVLGAQRSRFGSNRYGVRVDLNESFKLTPEKQYVHVLLNKPLEGRVMLVGLGSRVERLDQNPFTEQFWELSETPVHPGKWSDAVFPIKGAEGIDIRSLVVIPDCESPHNLKEDFLFYIKDIILSDSSDSRINYENPEYLAQTDNMQQLSYVIVNDSQLNGEVLTADGLKLNSYKAPINKDFKIKVSPEKGFYNGGIEVYVFKNPSDTGVGSDLDASRYTKYDFPISKFNSDNILTLPAEIMKGNILIQGKMLEIKN